MLDGFERLSLDLRRHRMNLASSKYVVEYEGGLHLLILNLQFKVTFGKGAKWSECKCFAY